MRRTGVLIVALGAAIGFAAGLLSSRPALAVVASDLYVQPGSATSPMLCGWHGTSGCPNAGGYGLDWASGSATWQARTSWSE